MPILLIILIFTFGHEVNSATNTTRAGNEENNRARIVGGRYTLIDEYPFMASIRYRGEHKCAGVILTRQLIITSAHCVDGLKPAQLSARIHSSRSDYGGTIVRFSTFTVHPEFDRSCLSHDIAILRMTFNPQVYEKIQTVRFPYDYDEEYEPVEGTPMIILGWGKEAYYENGYSTHLVEANVKAISRTECRKDYPEYFIDFSMMCAGYDKGGADACTGDSGGPLLINQVLIGIISWGVDCGKRHKPGVYAKVNALRSFIKPIMDEFP